MKIITNNIWKSFFVLLLTFALTTGLVSAAAGPEDGEYTIQVAAIHETNDAPTMADKNVKKPVKLAVKDGNMHAVITMTDSDVMKDLSFKNISGNFEPAPIIGEDKAAKETTYKLKIAQLDHPIIVQTYIVPMGMTVNFRLAFDPASLTSVTPKTTAVSQNTSPAKTPAESRTVPSPKTGDREFNTIAGVTTIVDAVEEGQNIRCNIEKSLQYVLGGNFGEAVAFLLAVLGGSAFPMVPSQIILVNFITESIPVIALAAGDNKSGLTKKENNPHKNLISKEMADRIIKSSLLTGLTTYGFFAGTMAFGGGLLKARTMALASLILSRMFGFLGSNSADRFKLSSAGVSLGILLLSIYTPLLSSV